MFSNPVLLLLAALLSSAPALARPRASLRKRWHLGGFWTEMKGGEAPGVQLWTADGPRSEVPSVCWGGRRPRAPLSRKEISAANVGGSERGVGGAPEATALAENIKFLFKAGEKAPVVECAFFSVGMAAAVFGRAGLRVRLGCRRIQSKSSSS